MESVTIMQLAQAVVKQLGSSSKIEVIPYEQAYEHGFEDMLRRKPDTAAIRSLLNWKTENTLEDIIADVAAEMQMQL